MIVHEENGQPIQVEDRWVNPACAPAYLEQDFTRITPNEHLMAAAPLQGATYSIEALPAPREVAEMLGIGAGQPCLVLRRRTTSQGPGGVGGDDVASGPSGTSSPAASDCQGGQGAK